jgi:molecular chaperone GrpE (heat shock protein)
VSDTETLDAVRRLSHEVTELRRLVSDRVGQDKTKEKAFDQLYDELKQYKDDFVFQQEKPLLLDLLLFYDSLNWFQESLIKAEMSPDTIADSFQYLLDEFMEVLYRRDVVALPQSDQFDRTVHKAVQVVAAATPEDDHRIVQVLKRGFIRADKPLRAEEVVIARHRES